MHMRQTKEKKAKNFLTGREKHFQFFFTGKDRYIMIRIL